MLQPQRWLIVPDTHAPFHSAGAVGELLKFAKEYRPQGVVLLGDFTDCYAVSSHSRDPLRKARLVEELEEAAALLARLVKATPLAANRRHYVYGNHEHRLDRYIWDKAPALHGMVSYEKAMGLPGSWHVTPYGRLLKVGKMHFTHDMGKAGSGAARQAMHALQGNVVIGHTHRMETFYEGNAKGEQHVGATLGWLGDFDAIDYRHAALVRREWVHGFGSMLLHRNGNVQLSTHPIF